MKKSTQNLIIKSMHTYAGVSVFVDQADYVWIMGCNEHSCLGVDTDDEADMERAVRTTIHLEPAETITQFYHCGLLTALYTSGQRLFISRVMEPDGRDGYRNRVGVYPNAAHTPDAEPIHDDEPTVTLPFSQEFIWPESIPISFSMPYAMYETKTEQAIETDDASDLAELGLGPETVEPKLVPRPIAPVVRSVSQSKRRKPSEDSEPSDEPCYDDSEPSDDSSCSGTESEESSEEKPRPMSKGKKRAVREPSEDDDDSDDDRPRHKCKRGKAAAKGKAAYTAPAKKPAAKGKAAKKQSKREESDDDSIESEEEQRPKLLVQSGDLLTTPHDPQRWSGHNFGSQAGHDNSDLNQKCGKLVSVHFSNRPGFVEALEGVSAVTFSRESVFFQRGMDHYIYNWKLTLAFALGDICGIKLRPSQHVGVLTYYQICMYITPSTVEYCSNYVYLHSNDTHYVLAASKGANKSIIALRFFKMDAITPDCIYVDHDSSSLRVLKQGLLYQYLYISGELELASDLGMRALKQDWDQGHMFVCISKRGHLVEYPSTAHCRENDLVANLVSISSSGFLLVDSPSPERYLPRPDIMCINLRSVLNHKTVTNGILIYDDNHTVYLCTTSTKTAPSFMCKISDYRAGGTKHTVYALTNLPGPIDEIHTSYSRILFRVGDRVYMCKLSNGMPGPCTEVKGESPFRVAEVDSLLIRRPSLSSSSSISIKIETCADKLERLASITEMFGSSIDMSVSYVRESRRVSYGEGIKRVFIQDAIAQFASTYLIKHNACTEFNLTAFECITAHQLHLYGRVLHFAMASTRSSLPLRMPIAFIVALKGSEPTIEELEYFVQKETPEAFERMREYRFRVEGLADCGYASYRECLQACVFHNSGTPAINNRVRSICQRIRDGFTSHMSIQNHEAMNLPTLDCYLSGDYSIDRDLLSGRIHGDSTLCEFMRQHIMTMPENKLAILLKNWTGTAILIDTRYKLDYRLKGIHFATCSSTLSIQRELVNGKVQGITQETIIDILTTPINFVMDN